MPRARGTRISSDFSSKGWLFGWCLPDDGNHAGCVGSFTSSLNHHTYTCSCDCHASAEKPNKNGGNLASLGVSDAESNL